MFGMFFFRSSCCIAEITSCSNGNRKMSHSWRESWRRREGKTENNIEIDVIYASIENMWSGIIIIIAECLVPCMHAFYLDFIVKRISANILICIALSIPTNTYISSELRLLRNWCKPNGKQFDGHFFFCVEPQTHLQWWSFDDWDRNWFEIKSSIDCHNPGILMVKKIALLNNRLSKPKSPNYYCTCYVFWSHVCLMFDPNFNVNFFSLVSFCFFFFFTLFLRHSFSASLSLYYACKSFIIV